MIRQLEPSIPAATMDALTRMCLPEALAGIIRTARRATVDNHGNPGSWTLRVPVESVPAVVDALQYARDRATGYAEEDVERARSAHERARIMEAARDAAEWTDRVRAYLVRERRIALRRGPENAILGTSIKVIETATT